MLCFERNLKNSLSTQFKNYAICLIISMKKREDRSSINNFEIKLKVKVKIELKKNYTSKKNMFISYNILLPSR